MEQVIAPRDGLPTDARFLGRSAASWPAIFAGAFVAVSATLVLIALGSGLGFAEISPWAGHGVSAKTFTVTTAIWLIVTQWLSAALGGYIAGRLRTKWVGTHTHEVFFRDTAHGLVTWAVATVFIAAVLAGAASSLLGGGMHALTGAASVAARGPGSPGAGPMGGAVSMGAPGMGAPGPGMGPAEGMMPGGPPAALTYEIDKLFRPASGAEPGGADTAAANGNAAMGNGAAGNAAGAAAGNAAEAGDPRVETLFIALHALHSGGDLPDTDRSYLTALVAAQTGIPSAQAQNRVNEFATELHDDLTQAKAAADRARKAAAETAIYTALAMLIGAFIASVSAAIGGRLRDEHP